MCFAPYIFIPYDYPDGTENCITNEVSGKAGYSARGTCKRRKD